MAKPVSNEGSNPIGHAWLRRELNLAVPPPAVESYVAAGARRTEVRGRRIVEQYPRQYAAELDDIEVAAMQASIEDALTTG